MLLEPLKNSYFRILALIRKEILTILKDPKSRIILIAPIIVQCVIFGYGASFHLEHIPYSFLSQSNSKLSYEFEQTLKNTQRFELDKLCTSIDCLQQSIDSQTSLIAIFIDADFDNTHKINIMMDARNTASANTALSYVSQIIEMLNQQYFAKSPLTIESQFLFNENNYTRYTVLIGMCLALSIIQVLLLSALSVTREKEEGSYDMMIMTPARPLELLLGKALPSIIIAIVQSLILISICYFYFEIPLRGRLIDVVSQILIFSFTIVGLGLSISTLSNTTLQSLILGFTFSILLILTSGLITSVEAMPALFKYVSYINPAYYGINGIWKLYLEGKTLLDIIDLQIPLVIMSILSLSLATYLFRHKLN